jgi:hypothetical protein
MLLLSVPERVTAIAGVMKERGNTIQQHNIITHHIKYVEWYLYKWFGIRANVLCVHLTRTKSLPFLSKISGIHVETRGSIVSILIMVECNNVMSASGTTPGHWCQGWYNISCLNLFVKFTDSCILWILGRLYVISILKFIFPCLYRCNNISNVG